MKRKPSAQIFIPEPDWYGEQLREVESRESDLEKEWERRKNWESLLQLLA